MSAGTITDGKSDGRNTIVHKRQKNDMKYCEKNVYIYNMKDKTNKQIIQNLFIPICWGHLIYYNQNQRVKLVWMPALIHNRNKTNQKTKRKYLELWMWKWIQQQTYGTNVLPSPTRLAIVAHAQRRHRGPTLFVCMKKKKKPMPQKERFVQCIIFNSSRRLPNNIATNIQQQKLCCHTEIQRLHWFGSCPLFFAALFEIWMRALYCMSHIYLYSVCCTRY